MAKRKEAVMRHWQSVVSFVVLACLETFALQTPKQPVPVDVQVQLSTELRAKKAKAGDPVVAVTRLAIKLPDGTAVPTGAKFLGHVVQVEADSAETHASFISLAFDNIEIKKGQVAPVNCTIRAAMMPALKDSAAQQQAQTMVPMPVPSGGMSGSPMGGMGGGNMGGNMGGGNMGGSANSTVAVPVTTQPENPKPVILHTGEVLGMRGVELQVAGPVSTFRSARKTLDLYEGLQMMVVVQP
jgi:hypothetical protein